MTDDITRHVPSTHLDGSLAELHAATSRRGFLRVLGFGATVALLPGFVVACGSDSATGPSNEIPGSGEPLLIDFESGDVAILQLGSVMEQIQAEFYSRVVAAFATSNIAAGEQAALTEIRDHELAHRAFLDGTLGADASRTATATFRGVNFSDRTSVLAAARDVEDLGIATYNGAAQYLTGTDTLLALAKIVSVEGRHSSAIRDLQESKTTAFSPAASDDVWRPTKSAASIQSYLVDKLAFANVPTTFIQGPKGDG
ncbi:MAG: ferritin-like domain-containing protein [Gemmatimonadaceae bacterium]